MAAVTSRLELHLLNVGQGEAILIDLPDGSFMLLDGGPKADAAGILDAVEARVKAKRRFRLAGISQWDADHIRGIPAILARCKPEEFRYPGIDLQLFEEIARREADEDLSSLTSDVRAAIEALPPVAQQTFRHSIDMRHRGQINEVEVELDKAALTEADLEDLRARFVRRYEQLYGRGASLPGARLECVTFRVRASAQARKPRLVAADTLTRDLPPAARTGARDIYWAEWKKLAPTPIYDGYRLLPGNAIDGPCVIETTTTSIVVHPGQRVEVDALRNFVIDTAAHAG